MDISAVLINKLLIEKNLDVWAKLKLSFLDPAYSSLYAAINRYYTNYSAIPSFDELEIVVRELPVSKTLATLRLLDEADVTAEVALDALMDQYTQNECIKELEKFVDKLPQFDTAEIKDRLSNIVLTLEEKTLTTEGVFSMADTTVFERPEDLLRTRIHLGINNTFDAVLGGVSRQELILIGGERGSGKSIACSNLQINQYESGYASVYFTIEMIAKETMHRNMSILAGVSHANLKNNTLTDEEILRVVKTRAAMFQDSDGCVDEFLRTRDRYAFEDKLKRECKLHPTGQMVIVDDRSLTLASIDLHLGKMKSRFGDNFTLAVIDYVNQIKVEGDQYDWKPQIAVSTGLKNLARKYDIAIVAPYQIDKSGEARFAKGILDAADIALVMSANAKEDSAMSFRTTKIRGATDMDFTSGMNWDSLRISPIPVDKPAAKEKPSKEGKDGLPRAGAKSKATGEPAAENLPWE